MASAGLACASALRGIISRRDVVLRGTSPPDIAPRIASDTRLRGTSGRKPTRLAGS